MKTRNLVCKLVIAVLSLGALVSANFSALAAGPAVSFEDARERCQNFFAQRQQRLDLVALRNAIGKLVSKYYNPSLTAGFYGLQQLRKHTPEFNKQTRALQKQYFNLVAQAQVPYFREILPCIIDPKMKDLSDDDQYSLDVFKRWADEYIENFEKVYSFMGLHFMEENDGGKAQPRVSIVSICGECMNEGRSDEIIDVIKGYCWPCYEEDNLDRSRVNNSYLEMVKLYRFLKLSEMQGKVWLDESGEFESDSTTVCSDF